MTVKIICDTSRMQTCGEAIWEDGGNPLVNTYCMRKRGHKGDHGIKNEEPKEEKKTPSKEDILRKYGPYSSSDPRSNRGF